MSRYLGLFVQESAEHLEAMGRGLLALERGEDPSAVDAVFRHAHSVKGMAASMGFEPIADLAHRLEDLYDLPRRGEATLGASEIDLALQVSDVLGDLVRLAGEGRSFEEAEADVPGLLGRLVQAKERLGAGGRGEAGAPRTPPPVAPEAPAPPASAPTPRGRSLRVTVQVASTSKIPGVRGFLVHKRLSALGAVLRCEPSLEDLKGGRMPGGHLEVVLSTEAAPETVEQALGTVADLERYRVEELPPDPLLQQPARGAAPAAAAEAVRSVRVRTDILDGFMDGVGELGLAVERLRGLLGAEGLEPSTPLGEALGRLERVAKDLNRRVMATRMTPLSAVTDRLPRVVRETARKVGKQVALAIDGAEIELDRAILDEIDGPLTHLLRNCIDHGLEDEAGRRAAGKPAEGRLRLDARRDRDRVVVQIADDGRGFDQARLRAAAVAAGHLTEAAAAALPDREALLLACLPGLSTKDDVTDLSGRGVGMDAVKATVESLGGTLEIESEPGRGTTFVLRLPLTVAIQRLLLVEAGGEVLGVPVGAVLHVTEAEAGAGEASFLDEVVPAFDLPEVLGLAPARPGVRPHVIFEGPGRRPLAAAVDALVGQIEAVIKPLGRPLDGVTGLSGTTLLADGRPLFVLDLASLGRSAEIG